MTTVVEETHVVAKLFPHPIRRFKIGDAISEADIIVDAPALDWADMKRRKIVIGAETKAADHVVEHAEELQAKAEEKNAHPEPAEHPAPAKRHR